LILLGDKDQLASVEAGAVMAQLCAGSLLRAQTVTLTYSHRFAAQGGIGQWAQAVNADVPDNTPVLQALWADAPDWLTCLPKKGESDKANTFPDVTRLQVAHAHDKQLAAGLRHGWREWLALLRPHLAGNAKPTTPCSDAQAQDLLNTFTQFAVLGAVREGPLGVVQLNKHIEHALGLGQNTWYAGRPVMVTRNNYNCAWPFLAQRVACAGSCHRGLRTWKPCLR
jgi:exodeoxyribonuclease V alpha subunit